MPLGPTILLMWLARFTGRAQPLASATSHACQTVCVNTLHDALMGCGGKHLVLLHVTLHAKPSTAKELLVAQRRSRRDNDERS